MDENLVNAVAIQSAISQISERIPRDLTGIYDKTGEFEGFRYRLLAYEGRSYANLVLTTPQGEVRVTFPLNHRQ